MTRAPALWAALLGVASGFAGGLGGARLVAGGELDAVEALRADLDRVEAGALGGRTDATSALAAVAERLASLEARVEAAHGAATGDTAAALRGLREDLRGLRDAVERDLERAETRLSEIERRLEQVSILVSLLSPHTTSGAPSEEDEAVWLALTRDADPLRRFSALAMLGRQRTDRSVRAAVEALHDAEEFVVWQAVRNLGAYGDKNVARDLAALLRHDAVAVRHAAYDALRRLGAPDVRFVASQLPEQRRGPAEALERWAAEAQ